MCVYSTPWVNPKQTSKSCQVGQINEMYVKTKKINDCKVKQTIQLYAQGRLFVDANSGNRMTGTNGTNRHSVTRLSICTGLPVYVFL